MRSTINFVLDLLLGIALLGLVWTGIVIRFLLPPGSGGRLGLWGFGRHDWGDVHFWLAVAVATIVVIHVAMHWN